MISLTAYKIVHLLALFCLFTAVGGTAVHAANRGFKQDNAARAAIGALHGIALTLIIVSGFGMLARLGIKHDWLFPPWLWTKLIIWTLFIFGIALPYRRPGMAKILLFAAPLLGALAGFFALVKPF